MEPFNLKMMRKTILSAVLLLFPFWGMQAWAQEPQADRPLPSGIRSLSTDQFLEEIHDYKSHPEAWTYKGEVPCIVDFYADWCGPCRMLAPVLEEVAREYEGKIRIYKVDIDKEKELATAFGIRSIPSLLFVPAKGMPALQAGFMDKARLEAVIGSFLLSEGNPARE